MRPFIKIEKVHQTPWLIEDVDGMKSETILVLNNEQKELHLFVRINAPNRDPVIQDAGILRIGASEVKLYVPELEDDGDMVTFSVYDNADAVGEPLASIELAQKKVRHWTIYVAHDIHLDIGYTDYQEDLRMKLIPGFLDEVMEEMEHTSDWPEAEQLKYPLEASYLFYGSAFAARDADWIEKLKKLLKEGRMNYPYNYVHFATEGMGTEQIARQNYYSARFLKDMLGVEPAKFAVHTDDAGFSWSQVDVLTGAGMKYLSLRLQDMNWNYVDRHCPKYPKLFYLRGRVPDSKLLVFDGPVYHFDDFGFREAEAETTARRITDSFLDMQTTDYPYDSYLIHLTKIRDNSGIEPNVMHNIHSLNNRSDELGRKYVFPHFVNSLVTDYFMDVEKRYQEIIPSFQGTLESFWNFGAAQVAYETSLSKENHENVPTAEMFSTFASVCIPGVRYPYQDILRAYDDMMMIDEHNWASWRFYIDDEQLKWSRSKAIEAKRLSSKLLIQAFSEIDEEIPCEGLTIKVYNNSSWTRTDVVRVDLVQLPNNFIIMDHETQAIIPWQVFEGSIQFLASGIPQYGYKTFRVIEKDELVNTKHFETRKTDTIENRFYKITLDASGAIHSILDRKNKDRELVDMAAPHKMNQFVYYTSKNELYENTIYSEDQILSSVIYSVTGDVYDMLVSEGTTRGADKITRKVILYHDLDRIDIVNEVVKADAPPNYTECAEEGFFTFPFYMPEFHISHDSPAGEIEPYVDADIHKPMYQLYWSNTDFYTVNHWININGLRDGVLFSSIHAPLVQYGGRRTCHWDKDYVIQKPWIYSWVFDNLWKTNFTYTQPGLVTFRYSIQTHDQENWQAAAADRFGFETTNPLKAYVTNGIRKGSLPQEKHSFITIGEDNILLTAAKPAEANGHGIILRFHETRGQNTRATVDVSSLMKPTEVWETDLVENDLTTLAYVEGILQFNIDAHGWKTIRLVRKERIPKPDMISAITTLKGTYVQWYSPEYKTTICYELYRDTIRDFEPGSGNYLATIQETHYYDKQVIQGLKKDYYYKVRIVSTGSKGEISDVIKARVNELMINMPPLAPLNLSGHPMGNYRMVLSWDSAKDSLDTLEGYRIYRDGVLRKEITAFLTSWTDVGLTSDSLYAYTVSAFNEAGLESPLSNKISVTTTGYKNPEDITPMAILSVSSELGPDYSVRNLTDGICGMLHQSNWFPTQSDTSPWIKLNWSMPQIVNEIYIYGRYGDPFECSGTLIASDGSQYNFSDLRTDGSATKITLNHCRVDWIELRFDSWGMDGGLSELQILS